MKKSLMLNSLVNGDVDTFSDIFCEYIEKSFSTFDVGGNEPEKFYHAFVLGILVNLICDYEVKSNRESGYGRYDIMIIPKDIKKSGVIIEFKKINKRRSETLETATQAALKQIEEKKYQSELISRGILSVLKLAIAFDGKEVLVVEGT